VRGLVRTISDGFTICYIQDLLVHSDYQHRGIGRELVKFILHSSEHIRQIVLMTDAKEELKNFYTNAGFREVKDDLCAFARLK
jgi:ribosomal protein S18 acetylase RimI-like enzyme